MKKTKPLPIPTDVSMATADLLAMSLCKIVVVVMCAINCIAWQFSTGNKILLKELFLVSVFVFIFAFVLGYLCGRYSFKEKLEYLHTLRKNCNAYFQSFETSDENIEKEIDKRMKKLEKELRRFFNPLIARFRLIAGNRQSAYPLFKKASILFDKKLARTNNPLFKKVGTFLESKISDRIVISFLEKKTFRFARNWVKRINLSAERKNLRSEILSEFYLKRQELWSYREEIDILVCSCKATMS